MKEYIDRQEAIESSLVFLVEYTGGAFDEELQEKLKTKIKTIPAADVVPVVRCEDCRYRVAFDKCCHPDGLLRAKANNFCNYGKRKE